jgi:uncharacterized protein (TIGR02145 family)
MRSLILLFFPLFISVVAKAQLKEFEITSLPKPEISLVQANTEFGEDALIIIYSSLTNLNFRSSMGMIDKQSYNPQSNRYEILVRPIKQILLVYSNGFMEGTISSINPNSKDVFYFKVEDKKTALLNQTITGKLTINSIPSGANISLNAIPVATKTPFTGELNPGPTRIQLSKSRFLTFDTVMNIQSSINDELTIKLKPSTLWLNIKSNPSSAQVELDGVNIGTTPLSKELDLTDNSNWGSRFLKLTLPEYAEQRQTIQVYPSKDPLKVSVDLIKLEAPFLIESTPNGADVFIDGVYSGQTPLQGTLPFGKYSVELKLEEYMPTSQKQIIVNAGTTANLMVDLILKKQPVVKLENNIETDIIVKDASGNSYKAVKIGDQVWMSENLKTDRYSNGDLIPNIMGKSDWTNLYTGAWCNYKNLNNNEDKNGKLYNWYAVADYRNVCPKGWHVPTEVEWTKLTDILGGKLVAGSKMKLAGWESQNTSETNESGFSGLPSGNRFGNGTFDYIGSNGYWWSSSEYVTNYAWFCSLNLNSNGTIQGNTYKQSGFSVRCLRD